MNLLEIVNQYGDIPFSALPLTEVDSLLFSYLAYLDYSGLVPESGFHLSLKDLAPNARRLCSGAVHPIEGLRLLESVCRRKRYEDLYVGYFSEICDDSLPMRFAAVCFRLPSGEIYASFRGTDRSIAAWREDFDLLLQNEIPSQREAVKYLSFVMNSEEGGFWIGGHSKGGNLALYASLGVSKELRKRILTVYDHDGPGFYGDVFSLPAFAEISDRFQKSVPHDSIVGMLMTHFSYVKVVKSRKTLFGQHNPFEWEEKDLTAFVTLPHTSGISRRAAGAIKNFVSRMDLSQRKMFVEGLFRVIEASGAKFAEDFGKQKFRKFRLMRRAFRALPLEEKKLVGAGGKLFMKIWLRVVTDQAKRRTQKEGEA